MNVTSLDKGDHVRINRIKGKSHIYDLHVICDVNRELFPVKQDSVIQFQISQDKTEKLNVYDPKELDEEEIFKGWDYVTHGTVFELKEKGTDLLHVGISFGGLLMALEGKIIHLTKIHNDEKVFCMMKLNQ